MGEGTLTVWGGLFALGAFHGLNPGMGWLFAVALGMQDRARSAVWRALLPLGLGHALAVVAAVGVALILGLAMPLDKLRWAVGLVLIGFGATRLVRHKHPRWASMRVGLGGLTLWSFLMASVHGAGLMVVPLYLTAASAPACHDAHGGTTTVAFTATAVHAAGYLLVTGVLAIVVFEKIGLGLLRSAWINLDLIWAMALIATGLVTLL
jgi:hypothetical protein